MPVEACSVLLGGLRSMMWTLAPLEWRIFAVAWPMPEAPPRFSGAVRRKEVKSRWLSYRL